MDPPIRGGCGLENPKATPLNQKERRTGKKKQGEKHLQKRDRPEELVNRRAIYIYKYKTGYHGGAVDKYAFQSQGTWTREKHTRYFNLL